MTALSRPPCGTTDPVLAELIEEFLAELQAGAVINPTAFAARYPEHKGALNQLLPALEALADLGESADSGGHGSDSGSARALDCGRLGDYRILREVGRGGMGVVYEAEQLSLRRRVALKVLPFAAVTDPKQLQRFRVEAQAAAQLHHTNIVPVHAVGCERGVHYYAMQFIDGETLARVIEELRQLDGPKPASAPSVSSAGALACGLVSGNLTATEPGTDGGQPAGSVASAVPPRTASPPAGRTPVPSAGSSTRGRAFFRSAAQLGIQAAEALEHAHTQGVLHRDVKPSNLMVDARGNLWVTDFGLARLQSEVSMTMTGDILGTLRYMSPEQALAKRVVIDHRTDIYSLGATLYELMTLHPVFQEEDRLELLRQIAFGEPRPLRRLNPAVPRELETIVLKALEKEPASRFSRAQELADDLRRFLEDRPIKAKRPTLPERAAKWARRHTTVVYSALVLLVLAVVGLSAGILLVGRERAQTEKEKETLRRQDYVHRISLALREIQDDGNIALAETLLDGCPKDLRGWEWNYVNRQAHLERFTYCGHLEGISGPADHAACSRTVECVAISPNGRWAASGTGLPWCMALRTDRAEIRLWDIETGRDRRLFDGLIGGVQGVAISPDGMLVAATGGHHEPQAKGGWLKLWDATTGKPLALRSESVSGMVGMSVAFSPDGRFLAVGYGRYMNSDPMIDDPVARPGRLTLINLETGEEWTPKRATDSGITSLAFCPDPDRPLLAVSGMHGVDLWDWKARTFIKQSPKHDGSPLCLSVAFSRDGQRIAMGGWDNTVRLWEPATDKEPRTLYGHKGYALSVAFSPDGTLLASTGEDRSVRLWEVATARELATFHGHTMHVFAVAFHPDGRRLLSAGIGGVVKVWDVLRSRPVIYRGHSLSVTGTAFSRDSRLVASESVIGPVNPVDVEATGESKERIKTETKYWDPDTGEEVRPSAARCADPRIGSIGREGDLAVTSPDGRRILKVTGSGNGDSPTDDNVQVIDAASGRVEFTLVGHTVSVECVALSPDGRRIATASDDRTVKLWDAETGQEVLTLRDHTAGVHCVAFSPDGHRLVSGSIDRTARVWDATPLTSEVPALAHTTPPRSKP